jgi:type II secretion system protein C
MLAHNINFDDNKLMINKFKDFLKSKLSRKSTRDSLDQDEFLDQEISNDDLQEGFQDEKTGHHQLPVTSSWKDKFKITLPSLRKKKVESDDFTSEDLAQPRESFADRLRSKISGNVKEWKLPEGFKSKPSSGPSILSPSLTRSIEKLLSREARETIHQVSLIAVICAITYTLGKVTALVLRGSPAIDSARNYAITINPESDFQPGTLAQVRSINIFRTNTVNGPKKKVADTKCDQAQQESALPIKLVNTIVLQDTIKSLASVQVRGDRDLQEVREGDQISDMARIFKITRLEILVKNLESGVCESIASEKARDAKSPISMMSPTQSKQFKANKKINGIDNVGNKFAISKTLLDEKMKDIASVLTQARAIKIQNPDGTLAFKLTEMDPQGIFPYLGLQDQDIITSINGKPIYDMNEVMGLFAKIKNLDNLQLGVKREGSDSLQEYSIKK